MNKSVAAGLVVGAAVALIGIALYRFVFAGDVDCMKPKHHCIRVSIDPDTHQVYADVPKLRKKGKKHVIWWYIDNNADAHQAYAFPNKGIAFRSAEGQTEFDCTRQDNPIIFRCDDQKGDPAPKDQPDGYKYVITVIPVSSSPAAIPEDPYIYND